MQGPLAPMGSMGLKEFPAREGATLGWAVLTISGRAEAMEGCTFEGGEDSEGNPRG